MHPLRSSILVLTVLAAFTGRVAAQQPAAAPSEYPGLETGTMWTFDVPPLEYWAKRYDFHPTATWLDHARLSAARIPGCSASFVSPDGLIMTNHHCARACIDATAKPGEDLLSNGFYAPSRAEERPCPGMVLDQLQAITDVTDSVAAKTPAGATPGAAATARNTAINQIEQACGQSAPDAHCEVVTMYRGGQYKLYRFRRFTDLRLVFAVEDQTAFFGGDPDNFTYPRYDLDLSMFRAYLNGAPAHPEYFKWSKNGAAEGDLVFVIGNPGSTGRLNTVAQMEYYRDTQYPMTLATLARQLAVYEALSAADTVHAKALRNTIFGVANSQKAVKGYQAGLLDPEVMAKKRAWETDFRNRVNANADLKKRYGDAWDVIATVRRQMKALDVKHRYYGFNAYGSRLLTLAAVITRYPTETAKPDTGRLQGYRDANRAGLERFLYSPQPVDTLAEAWMLTAYLTAMQNELPATDPVLTAALHGRTPEAAAREMVSHSQILTVDARKALIQGGTAAAAASSDPFLALARVIDPLERGLAKQWSALQDQEDQASERVARALLAVFGGKVAPDATFSLRISDGVVKRYPMNGTFAPPFTTMYGVFDRSASFGGAEPWNLMPKWQKARDSLNLATPINGVSTADIIGGNSGSPVINRDGEVVGLIFDENIEALPHRFLFRDDAGRSVWVDSRGIVEALRKVYGASALAAELVGSNP